MYLVLPRRQPRTWGSGSNFVMEVNGVDAETIGPELLTLVQGFFPDAATCDMAKFHEKDPSSRTIESNGRHWVRRALLSQAALGGSMSDRL